MSESLAGKGNRKPLLDINVDKIFLDSQNPRLIAHLDDPKSATQLDILTVLLDHFDTEIVALSLLENGYFDEEPLVVVPNRSPEGFKFADFDFETLTKQIQVFVDENEMDFTVVEGNRRTSAIKLILDSELRKKLNIDRYYPKTDNTDVIADISKVPCIIYEKRADVSSYLGVRHIAGLLRWEAFAQASYTANFIKGKLDEGHSVDDAIKRVQKVVGDRSDKLKKQYIAYKLFIEARDNLEFNVQPIVNKFSLLTVAYNSAAIREYIGVPPYSKADLESELIDSTKYEEFTKILTWIYGNKDANIPPVLTDSRKITNTLSHVVKSPEAIEYLDKYKDLDQAFERTNGELEYLLKKLINVSRAIEESLKYAYKYKSDENLTKQVEELEELIKVLKHNLE